MSYQATVLNIMIASPGDTIAESVCFRDVIHEWNAVNSMELGIVLMPADLEECDIFAAAFWTRMESGSKEQDLADAELEKHVEMGKPALLFFSSQPVVEGSVEPKQYKEFLKFKERCRKDGLYNSYNNPAELKEKFYDLLEHTVSEFELLEEDDETQEAATAETVVETEEVFVDENNEKEVIIEPVVELPSLSAKASELLKEVGKDKTGTVLFRKVIGSTSIRTNDKNFLLRNDTGEIIKWEAAIRELEYKGLLEDKNHTGETYGITNEGKRVAALI